MQAQLLLGGSLLGVTLLAACGGDAPAGSDAPGKPPAELAGARGSGPAPTPGAAPVPERPGAGATWFPGRRPPPLPASLELLRRLDPAQDDHRVEQVAVECERLLAGLMAGLTGVPGAPGLRGLAAPGARFGRLLGADPEPDASGAPPAADFDDGLFLVRGTLEQGTPLDLEGLRAHAAPWAGRLDPARSRFDVVRVEDELAERPSALARVRLVERGPAPRQIEARWSVELAPHQGSLRLAAVRPLEQREVAPRAPLFREVTEAVLSHLPRYRRELALGNDTYHTRYDWRIESSYVGMEGIAVGDVDGDGLEDLYVCQLGGQPNLLLRRTPDGRVEDIAAWAGVDFLDGTRGALLVDLDNDGALDLALARGPDVVVCWNDGTGRFLERTVLRGPDAEPIYSLAAADPTGDGHLDLFGCRYPHGSETSAAPTPYHDAINGASNLYWRNEGGRRFRNASAEVGIDPGERRFSYVALWEDLSGDGKPDLYVANDFGPNNLYLHDGGRFVDRARDSDALDMAAGMGISAADVDLDGRLDLYVSNMFSPPGLRIMGSERFFRDGPRDVRDALRRYAEGNTLLMNQGQGRFAARSREAGVAAGGWSWGAMFVDFQNDGLPDLYVPNGFISNSRAEDVESVFWRHVVEHSPASGAPSPEYRSGWEAVGVLSQSHGYGWNGRERNHLYLNLGGGVFADASAATDSDFLDDGRVAVRMDWDGDGLLDLVLRNRTGPRLRILHNVHPAPGGFLVLELQGTTSNRDAVGARVEVEAGGRLLVHAVRAGEGMLGQSSKRVHVGLGDARRIDAARVRWPSGLSEQLEGLEPDSWYRVVEGEGAARPMEPPRTAPLGELAARAVETVELAPHALAGRIPLADAMPLSALVLPGPTGAAEPLRRHEGSPVLILVFDPAGKDDASVLGELGERWGELERLGLALRPLSRGAGGSALLRSAGLPVSRAQAGQREVHLLQALLIEVLGPFEDLPQPLGLLLHPGGALVLVMMGREGFGELERDVARVRYMDPESRSTTLLTGGQWLEPPERRFRDLARVLQLLGERDLARALLQAHDAPDPR